MKKTHWHSCNVLHTGAESRHLWQFEAARGGFKLNREQSLFAGQPLPAKQIGKDWSNLVQRRLNVAWFPPEKVCLRVAHLPKCDFQETLPMVELQLEKISPLPVAQIVWAIHVLPHPSPELQTVVVIIVARALVEEFLGQLEGEGYLADRLELPLLDQILATPITGEGAWIYPHDDPGRMVATVTWWYGGALQHIGLVNLPSADNPTAGLKDQLSQMVWAGEVEGWLASPPVWRLVAGDAKADTWQPLLSEALGQSPEIVQPLTTSEIAGLTARRAADADPKVNLLPAEFSTRYHQQFVDRIWMRGLGAVIAVYMVIVVIYIGALQVFTYRTKAVEQQARGLGVQYTNAYALKERYDVLKERQDLKYAALDCWRALANLQPEDVTLSTFDLKSGKTFTLNGTVPSDKTTVIYDFYEALRKVTVNGKPLFAKERGTPPNIRTVGAGTQWTLILELNRTEEK